MSGLLARIFRKTATTPAIGIAGNDELFHGLNMKQAIDAHIAWRKRMVSILDGTDSEIPEVGHVAVDNQCPLGKWLHSHGASLFGQMSEYRELVSYHAKFHVCVGEILIEHKQGNLDVAADKLRKQFSPLSDQVQLGIVRLHSAARN